MKRSIFTASIAVAALMASVVALASPSAAVGSGRLGAAAPPLKFQKWVQGTPVQSFEKGKVYVVEFWATWCGPCKVSIPHLNEMSHTYKGQADFIGVSVWENRSKGIVEPEQLPKVDKFVKTMGEKMSYNIAADTAAGDMSTNWIRAYDQQGIPCAFIVDQQGRVAYVSHPMEPKFEESLKQVIAGTFDIDKARSEMEAESAAEAARAEQAAKISAAIKAGQPEFKALAEAGKTSEIEAKFKSISEMYATQGSPGMLNPRSSTLNVLKKYNQPIYYTYLSETVDKMYSKEPMALNSFAWTLLTDKNLKSPDYNLALKFALMADELTKHTDAEVMDTLALAYFSTGNKAKAIEVETKAITLATDPATKADLAERLASFKK